MLFLSSKYLLPFPL